MANKRSVSRTRIKIVADGSKPVYYYGLLGVAYYAIGNYAEAVKWASMGANEILAIRPI